MDIFIVPACMRTLTGIPFEERYRQTLVTFDSIRKQTKDAVIVCTDSSIGGLTEDQKNNIISKVDHFLDFSQDPLYQYVNQRRLKSVGECMLLRSGIRYAKEKLNLSQKGRMFKIGARCELSDKFTMDDYKDTEGKYVFKKRLVSWMDEDVQRHYGSTHILETRMFSWSLSMVDEYLSVLEKNFELFKIGFDTEHAHFLNIPKDKLLEFDMLNVGGFSAGLNKYMND